MLARIFVLRIFLPRIFLLWAICFAGVTAAADRYEERATHDPDGIGRFYMGREIARVMGPGGIPWLERDTREFEEKPTIVIEALRLRPGDTVADLGAGSGYYTFRLSPVVGDTGKVLAIDIEEKMLSVIRERAARQGMRNVETIRSTAADAKLAANSVDLLLMVDVYHELAWPYEMMRSVVAALATFRHRLIAPNIAMITMSAILMRTARP